MESLEGQEEIKSNPNDRIIYATMYGLNIWGHKFKKKAKELQNYSAWLYDKQKKEWKKEEIRFEDSIYTIPAFRMEIK